MSVTSRTSNQKAMCLEEIELHAQTSKTIMKLSSVHTSEEGGDETYMIIQMTTRRFCTLIISKIFI